MIARSIQTAFVLVWLTPWICLHAGQIRLSFDHYYDEKETLDALSRLHKAYPKLTRLQSIGKSELGRDIWAFTINNAKTGADIHKPGIYVDGSIHGNEIQATEVCLYLAWYLLDSYRSNPRIRKLVNSRAFYIVPIVNVDGRALFFEQPAGYNTGRTAQVPYDDDHDGLTDEDGFDDLDADGEILQMRVADPFGSFRNHPDNPKIMIRVEPGQKGQWRLLGNEGIDNDSDGRLNEDPPGYLDLNRNFGYKWQPPYVQSGAGQYPMSSKVAQAVSQFVLSKPNICFNVAFHNYGGMILRGPGSKLSGPYSPEDIKVYDYLGKEGEKIIPGYRYLVAQNDLYTTHGDFDEWMFSNLGIFGFVGELFMLDQLRYSSATNHPDKSTKKFFSRRVSQDERQKFSDFVAHGTLFKPWHSHKHPQFGTVEIGGWRKFSTRINPVFMLPELVHRNASLVIFVAQHAPEVRLEVIRVENLKNGLHRIRIRLSNNNALPTLSQRALDKKLVARDVVRISGPKLKVISGGVLLDPILDTIEYREYQPHKLFVRVPGFGATTVQWIVRGRGNPTVRFESVKSKNQQIQVQL